MVWNVTVVVFWFVSVYSALVAELPTPTEPKLIGPAGDKVNPPDTTVPESDRKLLLVALFPRLA